MTDEATRKQVLDLAAKGIAGTVFLTTDNIETSYEETTARGVEFTEHRIRCLTASTPASAIRPATACA